MKDIDISVVIPAYKSSSFIGATLDELSEHIKSSAYSYEVIIVVDGSPDDTYDTVVKYVEQCKVGVWSVIELSKNFGQHTANLCGFENASGSWVATMDDDGQNPPSELRKLEKYIGSNYDLVIGQHSDKKHNTLRRYGSKLVTFLNQVIFKTPSDLKLSNFRLIRADVVQRVMANKTPRPYIPGLCLKYSYRPVNVVTKHRPRIEGESNYGLISLIRLVIDLLFQHSNLPLLGVVAVSGIFSLIGIFGAFGLVVSALIFGVRVDGWTSLIVSLFFFSGLIMLTVSIIGFYLIRVLERESSSIYAVQRTLDTKRR